VADYNIKISFDDDNAGRKLEDLEKKIKQVAKPVKLDIKLPDFENTKKSLQEVGKYASVAATAFKTFTPIGKQFAEVEGNIKTVGAGLVNVSRILSGFSVYLNPIRGMSDGFVAVSASVEGLINSTARLGFAIFGVTQSVNVLKAAFGQMFDDTVGREVRLRESILQTSTTLAGTNRVLLKGVEIEDPAEKLRALESSVNASIERIRERSLEIAGTTSEAVISTFNVVASQIGSFGGTLREAEDLAVKFSGALGTLGMSNPMYARQEIGSIMMGYIDMNSILAKTLAITNADIQKAKQAGTLVEFLGKKLEVFEAGQQIAAKGFAGVTSNIQELQEELKRAFGSSLLDPLLKRIGNFYDQVSGKEVIKELMQTSRSFGQLIGSTLNSAFGVLSGASVFKGLNTEGITKAAENLQKVFSNLISYIQDQLARIAPSVQRIVDNVVKSAATLGKAFLEIGAAIAQLKIDQLAIQLQYFTALAQAALVAANAYAYYLKTIQQIISTPIGRYVNEVATTFKVLDQVGAVGLFQFLFALNALRKGIPALIAQIQGAAAAVGNVIAGALSRVSTMMAAVTAQITGAVSAVTTAVTTAVAKVLALFAQLTARIGSSLQVIGLSLALGSGALSNLAKPIFAVGEAFSRISTGAKNAQTAVTELGVSGKAAMTKLQVAANGASGSVNTLGASLRTGVAKGAQTAGVAVLGFAGNILKGLASMALWTIAISVVIDGLRRLSEQWDRVSQQQEFKQAIDSVTNGLGDQAEAARKAGKELDWATAALIRNREATLRAGMAKQEAEYLELQTELRRRAKNIGSNRRARERNAAVRDNQTFTEDPNGYVDVDEARKRNPALDRQIKELRKAREEAEKALRALTGEGSTEGPEPELRSQERKQAIQDLANFEKDARRSIEDEVYNYRRRNEEKELQLWRQRGELEIQQIDQANRRLIEGVDSEARASLEALNNWVTTKKRGELDIEAKKKEAQMAAAELERAVGRFRMNLEKQVAEIRKRIGDYEIDVLDKRIQAEQLIANIRNGSIVWEGADGGDGRAFVGNTGRSSGPHADIRGENRESVLNETMRAILQWQRDGVEYIRLSNARIDVKNITDQDQLRAAVSREIDAHGPRVRAGLYAADVAVPEGSRVPVPLGQVQWDNGGGGFFAVNPNTGNRWLHLKEGSQGSNSAGSNTPATTNANSPATGAPRTNVHGYLQRLSFLETGIRNVPNEQGSGAQGFFQTKGPFHGEARAASGGKNSRSSNYNESAEAVEAWIKRHRPLAHEHILAGRFDAADAILRQGTWPSLPGGSQARPASVQAEARKFLPGGGGNTPAAAAAAPGSASLASLGGAPAKPNVTLNIDTSELDSALETTRALAQQEIDLAKQSNDLTNTENLEAFKRSLDSTSAPLENITKELGNQEIQLKAVSEATAGGVYDPRVLENNIKYQQSLANLDKLRQVRLESISKNMQMSEADRATAIRLVNERYEKDKENLAEILRLTQARLAVEKQTQRLTELNEERRSNALDFEREKLNLMSQARQARFDPEDAPKFRAEAAETLIEQRRLNYTSNGKEPMPAELQASFDEYAKTLRQQAKELAALDQAIASSRRLRELDNQITQTRIDLIKNEVATRTEAAAAALTPDNFLGRRRLEAEQSVYEQYLDLTKGETIPLTEEANKKLQEFAEQALNNAESLAALDKELQDFSEKLALARESARTITDGYKGMISSIMQGGKIRDAVTDMGRGVAARFTEKLLDFAFRPMEQQLEQLFRGLFGADTPQEKNTSALQRLTNEIGKLTSAIESTSHTGTAGPVPTPKDGEEIPHDYSADRDLPPPSATNHLKPGDPTFYYPKVPQASGAAPVQPTAVVIPPVDTTQAKASINDLGKSTQELGKGVQESAQATAAGTAETLTNMQKYATGLASVATAALSIVGGVQMIKKGGTSNVLGGIGSIFLGLGGALGGFGKIGARAMGGPVNANAPYLVGEKGPELFMPNSFGSVKPNNSLRNAMSGAARQQAANSAVEFRFTSEVINNREYISRDQLDQAMVSTRRRAAADGARRGMSMTLDRLQQSPRTRSQVGLR
jgi:hypothetical protein